MQVHASASRGPTLHMASANTMCRVRPRPAGAGAMYSTVSRAGAMGSVTGVGTTGSMAPVSSQSWIHAGWAVLHVAPIAAALASAQPTGFVC